MRQILALVMAMALVCSGCGEVAVERDTPAPEWDWMLWEGEMLELQRRLVRWYGICLEDEGQSTALRESYENILAGPGGLMGVIRFPEAEITLPIFHHGWEGNGFVHDPDSPFPVGEGGTAVLTMGLTTPEASALGRLLAEAEVFQICILDRILTYRITREAPGEMVADACVLVISGAGEALRLTGVPETE